MRAIIVGSSALALGALIGLTGVADAGVTKATVTVTIQAQGTDLSGVVKSSNPMLCAANRKVQVYKQKGTRGGGDDIKFASDTTDLQSGRYVWSTGNTGTAGKFYAKVGSKPGCKADFSPTIVAVRNP